MRSKNSNQQAKNRRPAHFASGGQHRFCQQRTLAELRGCPGQYQLSDNGGPLGPGDPAYAFEWDLNIDAGASVLIGSDTYVMIPEPSGPGLFGCFLVLSVAWAQWRKGAGEGKMKG